MNKEELQNLHTIMKTNKVVVRSKFIKEVILSEIKPFLSVEEKELFSCCIYELNAIGRNLNQLLRFKAFSDIEELIKQIKDVVVEIEEIL